MEPCKDDLMLLLLLRCEMNITLSESSLIPVYVMLSYTDKIWTWPLARHDNLPASKDASKGIW